MRTACVAAALLALAGCASTAPQSPDPMATPCTDPRPELCTMEYAPACAELASGDRREYASACNACADTAVTGYVSGPCPE